MNLLLFCIRYSGDENFSRMTGVKEELRIMRHRMKWIGQFSSSCCRRIFVFASHVSHNGSDGNIFIHFERIFGLIELWSMIESFDRDGHVRVSSMFTVGYSDIECQRLIGHVHRQRWDQTQLSTFCIDSELIRVAGIDQWLGRTVDIAGVNLTNDGRIR